MRAISVWVSITLAYWFRPFVSEARYVDPIPPGDVSDEEDDGVDKQVDLIEPTCEELRTMWRYTKRQSRAAKTTTGYPIYHGPFSYNMWESYPERTKPNSGYKGKFAARARSRAAGGSPIYGRMVHKAPAGSRLRNGMRQRTRAFEDVARFYGTINRYQPSSRRRTGSFRVGGGGASPPHQLPQTGSFQHLRELIRAEHARELQQQHIAERIASQNSFPQESPEDDNEPGTQQSRKQFLNPLPHLQIPPGGYEYGQGRYMSNVPSIGQAWSRSGPHPREYPLQ